MVNIKQKHYLKWNEWWCPWFSCPNCKKEQIAYKFKYCPDCGIKLIWSKEIVNFLKNQD